MPKQTKKKKKTTPASLHLYSKIAVSFVVLTLILLAVVFYFSTSKAHIIIVTKPHEVKADIIVDILDGDTFGLVEGQEAVIGGAVVEKTVESEKVVESTGIKKVSGKLEGKATIINNYSRDQILVATTRLLNKDDVLFRMKDRVVVPAGGSVEVEIYADDPTSITGEVEAGTWTIPGLWSAMQEYIYAETKQILAVGDREVSYVTEADLVRAQGEMKSYAKTQADKDIETEVEEMQLKNDLSDLTYYIFKEDVGSFECDAEKDDQVEEFTCTISVDIKAVVFQNDDLEDVLKNSLAEEIPDDLNLISFNKDNYSFSLDHYGEEGEIGLSASVRGLANMTTRTEIFAVDKILGLVREEAIHKLEQEKFIREANVIISPFWLKKVPTARDRVELEIK